MPHAYARRHVLCAAILASASVVFVGCEIMTPEISRTRVASRENSHAAPAVQTTSTAKGAAALAPAPSTATATATPPARGAVPAGRGPGGAVAPGQAADRGIARGVVSPQVSAEHRITFRFQAPNAQRVQVQGDFTLHTPDTLDLVKDASGVWSVTTDVLKPSSYQYWFIMDGVTMPDPLNTYVRAASGVYKSQVDVPGPEMEFMAFRDVPHGVLREHWYINRDNGTERRVVIYTPPGYDASNKSYPVLYLLHGANDFERGWTQTGRANWIMDNLLADGKALPAIIVMPFGHDVTGSTGRQAEIADLQKTLGITPAARGGRGVPGAGAGRGAPPVTASGAATVPSTGPGAARGPAGARGGGGGGFGSGGAPGVPSYMEKDLLTNVIPLVEKEYRVIKDPAHRAIFGYSMGAGHSSAIGLNHPELFAYVGVFSGGTGQNMLTTPLADAAKTNAAFKLVWLGCGDDDSTALNGTRSLDRLLTTGNIKHEYVESPGYHHDYQIWRIYLNTLLPRLFRD